jgi:hypothetical protein
LDDEVVVEADVVEEEAQAPGRSTSPVPDATRRMSTCDVPKSAQTKTLVLPAGTVAT